MIAVKRLVEFTQQFNHVIVISTDNDTLRTHTVADRRAFFQKLWVRHHIKRDVKAACLQGLFHYCAYFICRANRYGRFVQHHFVLGHVLSNGTGYCRHIFQVC